MQRRNFLLAATAGLALPATAQAWPARPIKLVVPFPAGSSPDLIARVVAEPLGPALGTTIVIDNRPGAGGNVGTGLVAKAEPDGYTLLLGQSGPISINPAVYKDLRYDPVRDFAPITMTTAYPYILVVNAKLPVKSLQEFIALAKSKPGSLNYGTTGIGAANHLVTELFSGKAGLKMTHVPYRGTELAVADLVAGQVDVVFGDPISVLPHMKAGTLRALAVTSRERSAVAPEVPTVAESGYPGFDAIAWHGILAPANTPPIIVKKLNAEIVKALQNPETKTLLTNQAMQTVGNTPEEFAAFIKQDIAIWKAVATEANVSVK
jgi:tripartite-type tricarboxylate transporter receptor subunit TctC